MMIQARIERFSHEVPIASDLQRLQTVVVAEPKLGWRRPDTDAASGQEISVGDALLRS